MINSEPNLLNQLRPQNAHQDELQQIILEHFGSATFKENNRELEYPSKPPHALRTVFDKDGYLTGIFAETALNQEDLNALKQRVGQVFLDSIGTGVSRAIMFSVAKVEGCWRYKDHFQILPVPPPCAQTRLRRC